MANGMAVDDAENSMTVGPRGPALMQDVYGTKVTSDDGGRRPEAIREIPVRSSTVHRFRQ